MNYKEALATLAFVAILLVIYYFSTWHEKKRAKVLRQMQQEIKVNDKVITFTGLSGVVTEATDEYVVVKLRPDNICVTIERWAIAELDERSYD